jgi:hypothetical protein
VTELNIDLSELKVSEIEEIEDRLGIPIGEAFGQNKPMGKSLRALGFVIQRRDNPEFTWEEAGDLVVKLKDDVPPTDANG